MNKFEMPNLKTQENKETNLEQEELEIYFESLINTCEKVNEGNNGVIAKIDLGELPEDSREILAELMNIPEEKLLAMKVLKVYTEGAAKREFESQKKALEILDGEENVAKVPEIYYYSEVNLENNETKKRLEDMGVKGTETVEILLMDYVEGKDLWRILLEEVVERSDDLKHLEGHLEGIDLPNLNAAVGDVVGYMNAAGGKSAAGNAFEATSVMAENQQKLFNYLQQRDFKINPEIRKKLEKTINLLHENNLYHRCINWRNVMIKNYGKEDEEVVLIDFGAAKTVEGSADPYTQTLEDGDETPLRDESILASLKDLEKTKKEEIKEEADAFISKALEINIKSEQGIMDEMAIALEKGELIVNGKRSKAGKLPKKEIKKLKNIFDELLGWSDGDPQKRAAILIEAGKKNLKPVEEYVKASLEDNETQEPHVLVKALNYLKSA